MSLLPTIAASIAAAAAGAGVVFGVFKARADHTSARATAHADERAEIRELVEIKDEMITALREANAEAREQVEKALAREQAWIEERSEYKRKLDAVDEAYRTIVRAVVNAGICLRAPACPNYLAPGHSGGADEGAT